MKKITLFLILIIISGCSKKFDDINITNAETFPMAKIDGNHLIFISNEKFKHKKKFSSEDCESWSVNLNFDDPMKQSIKNVLDEMLKKYSLTNIKLSSSEIEKKGYVSQISFFDFQIFSNFYTERNTGKYDVSLKAKVRVENSSKNITNEISSNMSWEKNIFLNCNLKEGATKTGQKALNNLLKNIYESSYESLYQITK